MTPRLRPRQGRRPGRRVGLVLLALVGFLGMAGCGGDGNTPPPGPGPVLVHLDGATTGDEALLLDIAAGATSVQRARDDVEVHARPSTGATSFRVAVFGRLGGSAVLRVIVNDPGTPPAFTLREVAASDGTLRGDLASYRVRVERAP